MCYALAWKSHTIISTVFCRIHRLALVSEGGAHTGVNSRREDYWAASQRLAPKCFQSTEDSVWHRVSTLSLGALAWLCAIMEGQGVLEGHPGLETPAQYLQNLVTRVIS